MLQNEIRWQPRHNRPHGRFEDPESLRVLRVHDGGQLHAVGRQAALQSKRLLSGIQRTVRFSMGASNRDWKSVSFLRYKFKILYYAKENVTKCPKINTGFYRIDAVCAFHALVIEPQKWSIALV